MLFRGVEIPDGRAMGQRVIDRSNSWVLYIGSSALWIVTERIVHPDFRPTAQICTNMKLVALRFQVVVVVPVCVRGKSTIVCRKSVK